ncbi:MAG: hypothetical protein ACHQIG_09215 [Acidimicrobiia bacterium]
MRVVALVDDLMDRARVTAAIPDVEFGRTIDACADAEVVVIDLARYATSVAGVRACAPTARIVAFGPHVDEALLTRARADGADLVTARSAFFRNPGTTVSGV